MRIILFPCIAFGLSWGSSTAFVVPKLSVPPGQLQQQQPTSSRALKQVRCRTESTTSLAALPAFTDGVIKTASSATNAMGSATNAMTASPMFEYFLQTVISYAVPTFFTVATIAFAASAFRKDKDDDDESSMDAQTAITELYSDLYGNSKKGSQGGGFPFQKPSKSSKIQNLGIPSSEYIKITNLNEKFESYDFSLSTATKSKAFAAAKYRSKSFDRALQLALTGDTDLPAYAKSQLLEAEKTFLKKGKKLVGTLQALEGQLAREAIDKELKRQGVTSFDTDPEPVDKGGVVDATIVAKNETKGPWTMGSSSESLSKLPKSGKVLKEVSKLQRELKQLELEFIQDVVAAVGSQRAIGVRAALLGDISARGAGGMLTQLEERPLSALLQSEDAHTKSLFVMRFPGDVTASQLDGLREEITAIVRNAKEGDEALVILQSGGGTVTGYGLAAGQLVRLKEKGMFLTMAVEQVAASGGYMMACVADRIVASPFAVLGSIGVISETPNVYERLKTEGIEFQTVTAGKFKRTITPTKKVSKLDLEKSKEDVEGILVQFSDFVGKNRPSLVMDEVATGETWFGNAALEKGLCDEIKTVDDVLLNYVDLGYNVYEIDYSPPQAVPSGLAGLLPFSESSDDNSIGRRAIRWLVGTVASEVRSVIGSDSADKKYLVQDDTADRVQMRD